MSVVSRETYRVPGTAKTCQVRLQGGDDAAMTLDFARPAPQFCVLPETADVFQLALKHRENSGAGTKLSHVSQTFTFGTQTVIT